MKEKTYYAIMDSIKSYRGLSRDCAYMLVKKYPSIAPNTLHSILSEAVMYATMSSRSKLHGSHHNYFKQYKDAKKNGEPPGIIVRMAAAKGLPPSPLAKVILEDHCKESKIKIPLSQLMTDTTLIEDGHLAYEIYLTILHDDKYGYISDSYSRSVGYEYEVKLKNFLNERNIAFCDEHQLRGKGYDKTPDFKLEVPIAVNGFVINWIESKARFGAKSIHVKAEKEQYLKYWNRFGPGLVIYWYDFIDTLQQPNEKKYIIMNHFPENITYMNADILQEYDT